MTPSETKSGYIGRFAPSPTGLLHLGSLLTAIASYCDAIYHNGKWLLRIEDLDPPREIKGASDKIINTLNKYGFTFDNDIIFQSNNNRQQAYQQTLIKLEQQSSIYYCSCSRKQLANQSIDTHSCRTNILKPDEPYSIKLKVPNKTILFNDAIQNEYNKHLVKDCGDFVIRRKDGLFSYQIAVVVDDNFQQVTNIVRGIDLIDSTPWQIYLNSLLGYTQLEYAHIPVLVNNKGQKLSKQTYAKEINNENPLDTLIVAYKYLNQTPFTKTPKTIKEFWKHAINNWQISKIPSIKNILDISRVLR